MFMLSRIVNYCMRAAYLQSLSGSCLLHFITWSSTPAVEERAGEMSIVLNKYPEIRMCTASRFPRKLSPIHDLMDVRKIYRHFPNALAVFRSERRLVGP
jgi:hypothetical protein